MATTLVRIIKYGLQSFWRNGLLSVATVNVMILALLVFEALIIFSIFTKTAVGSLQDKIDISVYFKTNASEEEILNLKKSLENISEVKSVEYVSRERALELFQEKHKNEPVISKALEELENNPLLASLNIKANDLEDYPVIDVYLNNEGFKNIVEKITFAQTGALIEKFNRFIDTINKSGLILIIFSALTAVLVAFNTIRLAIYSNREEIGIMRLVGASNIFINGPYIVEAIIFGIIAAILSSLIIWPFISLSAPYIKILLPELDLKIYFYGNIFKLFFYQLLFGIGLSVISGVIAIRKYLKI